MKFQIKGKIIFNTRLCDNVYHMRISVPEIAKDAQPGQFVHIRIENSSIPLLRRPMSIFNVERKNIEIVYRLKGEGTNLLSQKQFGEYLDILGPLGNGFDFSKNEHSIIIGGGMGLVPLFYLAKNLKKKKNKFEIYMGARTCEEFVTLKHYRTLAYHDESIKIATDNGSMGFKGNVVKMLDEYLKPIKKEKGLMPDKIYSCGPPIMLKAVQKLAARYKIPCEISLEEYMGCGVGACLSCVCKTKDNNYKRVCAEGPVFSSDEVIVE